MEQSTKTVLWVVGIVVGIIAIAAIASNNSNNSTNKTNNSTYSQPKTTTPKAVETPKEETKVTWHCVDATSYDKNAYNDNRCTSSAGETRYVSDSQAVALDPEYTPGQGGHPWYNAQ